MEKFIFKKKYGQNFLKDKNKVKKIVDSANIKDKSLVIEVGPGGGILTTELSLKADNVLCYEIDLELKSILVNKFSNSNVSIIFDDFLNRNIENDIEKYNYDNLYFISNVPYYITTPILLKLINSSLNFDKIVIMVQEEVGERFSAKPNSKDYSSITVFLNYYFDVKREFKVNRLEFNPVPNVDSEVISFTRKDKLLELKDKDLFFKLVKDSFRFKRKNIKNNLKDYNLDMIEKVLIKNNLNLSSRAERIPLEIFVDISNELSI